MTTPEDLDARLRQAAARHHEDVLATVDVAPALDASRRPSRRPVALAALAAAVVALFAGVLALQPEAEGDVDVAIDEDGLEDRATEDDRPAPDFDNAPAPIGLGAPDDGKDSVQLPVVADPATGLVDGQTVVVSGKGFPPDSSVGVVMCTKEAGQDHGGRGVEACDITHYGSGTSDAQGVASVEFRVRRIVPFDGEDVDCAAEPGRCIIGMGLISDYDQSGGVAVDFDPSVPLPDKPTVELTKSENLVDGETVRVAVTGLDPNASVSMSQCTDEGSCAEGASLHGTADESGTFEGSIRLWRTFGAYGPNGPTNADCAAIACTLLVHADLASSWPLPTPELTFDPSRGARVPPTLSRRRRRPVRRRGRLPCGGRRRAGEARHRAATVRPGRDQLRRMGIGRDRRQPDGAGGLDRRAGRLHRDLPSERVHAPTQRLDAVRPSPALPRPDPRADHRVTPRI